MSTETAFLSVRLPVQLRHRLKAVAARRGVSLQTLMHDALEALLRREEAEPPKLAEVVAKLREHASELRTRGVRHLYVFGSVARGDARVDSDVDLAIDVDPTSDFSLITLGSVAADLEGWLDRGVDLGERSMLRPSLRADFERDAVRIFQPFAAMARAPDERLQDMRTAIDRIKRMVAGLDQTSFERAEEDALIPICWSFVVIGEAIKALPNDLLGRHAAVDWKGFARFRNVLAHQYFRIDRTFLWKAIVVSLPPLDAAVAAEQGAATTQGENDG